MYTHSCVYICIYHICTYMCIYVYITYVSAGTLTLKLHGIAYTHAYICVYMYIFTSQRLRFCWDSHTDSPRYYICIHIYVCMYMYGYVCMHICTSQQQAKATDGALTFIPRQITDTYTFVYLGIMTYTDVRICVCTCYICIYIYVPAMGEHYCWCSRIQCPT